MSEDFFVGKLQRTLKREGFLVKREVGVGYGVADLVLIKKTKINAQKCIKRIGYKQRTPLLGADYFRVLKHIPDQETGRTNADTEYLFKKTRLSKPILKYKILASLEKHGYIRKVQGNFYLKINGWLPITTEVIAIEAKMKDWKRGLIQANRYKLFADKVYLAVPFSIEHLVDRGLLEKHNIGLLALDAITGEKKILVSPKKSKPINEYKKNFATEFFWNRSLMKTFSLS